MIRSLKVKVKSRKLAALTLYFLFLALPCFAQSVSSAVLIEHAKEYDGKTVTFQGEVIGDIMARGNFAWININDGNNAIGIWLPKEFTADIKYTGSYKFSGDVIEVTGIFNRACKEHGGDLDIHATEIIKVSEGSPIKEKVSQHKIMLAIAVGSILCLILILQSLHLKHLKK